MTLRKPPKGTTGFLKQFGSQSADETVIGDLTEQYQRGHGSIWYWRQVLSIVFVSHFRNIQRDKWNFFTGFFRVGCVWVGLTLVQILVMSQVARSGKYSEQALRNIYLAGVSLRFFKPLAIGAYIRRASRSHSRTVLLAFITSYVVWNIAGMVRNLLLLQPYLPPGMGFIFVTRNLTDLLLAVPLILLAGIWGQRGLSHVSLKR